MTQGSAVETEERAAYAAATSPGWGDAPLPKRNGTKTLLPGSWIGRELTIEYADAGGKATSTRGTLLDLYPAGVIMNIRGARTCVLWERICLVELVGS